MFQSQPTLRCSDIIGMPYRLGGDGSDGTIDCINLVYIALKEQGVGVPTFDPRWYEQSWRTHLRALLTWGEKVQDIYNGDVLWQPGEGPVFAAIWQNGILHISQARKSVHWLPAGTQGIPSNFRCFRMKGN